MKKIFFLNNQISYDIKLLTVSQYTLKMTRQSGPVQTCQPLEDIRKQILANNVTENKTKSPVNDKT